MKIFSAAQINQWDEYTIQHEPVSSIDLMERAANACAAWIIEKFDHTFSLKIFCGSGNNGGDGLAIARLLLQQKFNVQVFIISGKKESSVDFNVNLKKLQELSGEISFIESKHSLPAIEKKDVIVDALFGTGLNKKVTGIYQKVINYLNKYSLKIISIDVPSGLYTDKHTDNNIIICASYTLTFQQMKMAFLYVENESYCGEVIILPIGLSKKYYEDTSVNFELLLPDDIYKIYVPRKPFANKGNFGYACIIAGSYGMMGAAVMSAQSCLRSGVGKLTGYICRQGYNIMQARVPEAMCKVFGNTFITDADNVKDFSAIGIGPGIGNHPSHKQLLLKIFKEFNKPMVIDADALNVMSKNQSLYKHIPAQSIITPHPKEFERLFGKCSNDFERTDMALQKAKELNIIIVLKGHHTFIATPGGTGYFNSTGNAGMATAGSGDVLTGIITGLLAQNYTPEHAAIFGVYLHGKAGNIAAAKLSKEALIAGDITEHLGDAFIALNI